ncbi:hypothetical protein C8Q74DRAFT_284042 [Fomes fomentarius]|nr:hypothetical protein C8Q74DRAFT_284042 [Fomes fomentarius]
MLPPMCISPDSSAGLLVRGHDCTSRIGGSLGVASPTGGCLTMVCKSPVALSLFRCSRILVQ